MKLEQEINPINKPKIRRMKTSIIIKWALFSIAVVLMVIAIIVKHNNNIPDTVISGIAVSCFIGWFLMK